MENNHEIAHLLLNVDKHDLFSLFSQIQNNPDSILPMSRKFNYIADYFTYEERLNTIGSKGMSFYDFWKNFYVLLDKPSLHNLFIYFEKNRPDMPDLQKAKYIFDLYSGSVSNMSIHNCIKIYEIFPNSKLVLDPCSGWGNRAVAAAACGLDYYGFDNNPQLERPYMELEYCLRKFSKQDIQLDVIDCLTMDYSTLDYDLVFTSPPYYDKEMYAGKAAPYNTKKEWNSLFYKPLVRRLFDNLAIGGAMCLDLSEKLYQIVREELGEADTQIPLVVRPKSTGYRQYIYIWKKPAPV